MDKQRSSRSQLLALAPPLNLWPDISQESVDDELKETFNNRCRAIQMYLEGEAVNTIQVDTGVSRTSITDLLRRCLQPGPDGNILGYTALIPFYRLKEYERKAEVKPKFREDQGGLSGIFKLTLKKFPDVEKILTDLILKRNSSELSIHEKRIAAKDTHRIFLKLLSKKGVKESEWPFSTKHQGLTSIKKYLNEVLDANFVKGVRVREEEDSIAHLAVGTGKAAFLSFEEPYEAVQFDAYCIDAIFSAEFDTPEGFKADIQLDRLWLITLIECVSRAIIAYSVVYRSQISATDLLDVLRNAINPPERIEITLPGLNYPESGGLPHEVIPHCRGVVWNIIFLDGALAHLANIIQKDARNRLGMSINWGPVAHFERRSIQERFFEKVAADIFKRLPSTTGSHPKSGRAKNAEKIAVKYKFRAEDSEQLLAIYVAEYNATPSEGISFLSPINVLQHFFQEQNQHFLPRYLPQHIGQQNNPIPISKVVSVIGGKSSGRRPYIGLERERYTNDVLSRTLGLVGQKIRIEIDDRDLRQVRAFLLNGAELGYLKVMGRWQQTKHSLKTRKIINSLITKRQLVISKFENPVHAYMKLLTVRNKKITKKTKDITPQNATEATRLAKETGLSRKITPRSEKAHSEDPVFFSFNRTSLMPTPMPDIKKLLNKR
jgi:hypothetical protein